MVARIKFSRQQRILECLEIMDLIEDQLWNRELPDLIVMMGTLRRRATDLLLEIEEAD